MSDCRLQVVSGALKGRCQFKCPVEVFLVVFATLITWLCRLDSKFGVHIVGETTAG